MLIVISEDHDIFENPEDQGGPEVHMVCPDCLDDPSSTLCHALDTFMHIVAQPVTPTHMAAVCTSCSNHFSYQGEPTCPVQG